MSQTERLYQIEQLLKNNRFISTKRFLAELEISVATLKRDLDYLRDRMGVPIEWCRELRGYVISAQSPRHELPGLWFSASEIHALLTMQQLLQEIQPGLLTPHITPLLQRLTSILTSHQLPLSRVAPRIRILRSSAQRQEPKYFSAVASAVLLRQQIQFNYFVRSRALCEIRTVSPQRLVHYRGNWYLDAWCHLRNSLRSFALDAIRQVTTLELPATEITDAALDEQLGTGYGIFSGSILQWAELCFSPEQARYVSCEIWHVRQQAQYLPDGSYLLRLPYTHPKELIMDILRHGAAVQVLAPESLREAVKSQLQLAYANYAD